MSRWFLYFVFYSLAGYVLEKLFARAVRAEKQVRKCFLLLPLCPVYGLAMTVLLAVSPPGLGFGGLILLGAAVCTAVEYAVHLFYDRVFHVRFWDYHGLRGHIRGRVCPHFSVAWGLLSAAAVRWIQPAVRAAAARVPPWAVFLLWMVLAADCVLTAALLLRRRDTELLAIPAAAAQILAESQSSTS